MTGTPGTPGTPGAPGAPVQRDAEVLATRRLGSYTALELLVPGIAERFEPGQFAALAVGGPGSSMLLRRSFSIYRAQPRGAHGGTLEVVFAAVGAGTDWLARRRPGDRVDVLAPLGRPFPLPPAADGATRPPSATLVGGGYGSAPLFALADRLRARGARVGFVLGAASEDRLLGALEAKRVAPTVVTTDDGSAGTPGRVSDVLPEVLAGARTDLVYACGPMPMLAAVAAQAAEHGAVAYTAVEEAMACGIGVCMTCVLPVTGGDGVIRMTRACVDGPVFRGDAVRWAEVGTVPADVYGAAR